MSSGVSSHNTQRVRALQVYMVDFIATEYEAKCSALIVVVFPMLVGSVAADTKATKELLTHSTTTQRTISSSG